MNLDRRGFFRFLSLRGDGAATSAPATQDVVTPVAMFTARTKVERGSRMNLAMVPSLVPQRCLATTSMCSTCVEHCRVEGAMRMVAGLPQVDAANCTGCGDCLRVCPAPVMAFTLRPRSST